MQGDVRQTCIIAAGSAGSVQLAGGGHGEATVAGVWQADIGGGVADVRGRADDGGLVVLALGQLVDAHEAGEAGRLVDSDCVHVVGAIDGDCGDGHLVGGAVLRRQ